MSITASSGETLVTPPEQSPNPGKKGHILPSFKPALTLHVSPGGNDAGTGKQAAPFRSLERARDEIRTLARSGAVFKGGVKIILHGGSYPVSRTFDLSAQDSAHEAGPLHICAAPGEQPVFRGGVRLKGWRHITSTDEFPLLPLESRPGIWCLDLRSCGVTNILPLKLGGYASGGGFVTHPNHELFFNGKAMQLARGPNQGFLRITDVAVKDGTKGYDREGSRIGKLFFGGEHPKRWVKEPDLMLYGYWFWDWADSYERVVSIDAAQRLIVLSEPWHGYGYSKGAPFYAVNALSELDMPGEWYLDRHSGKLLFYAPSDPNTALVEFSLFAGPMVSLKDVSHVTFEGLTWELGSGDGLQVAGGTNCVFAGCTVRYFAGNGVKIHGGHGNGLLSCDVFSMGRGGTIISGGDRRTLTPGGHFVENCDIHDLSRIDHTYTPAVLLDGVGNRIVRNRLHEVLSSALRVGGNDQLIEGNEIFNVVTESDDQGGADMWGNPTFRGNIYRYNYWHHIGNWRAKGEQPKCGQAGIRLDDAICGTSIYGNIFERCSTGKTGFGGVQIHGGKDNRVENNLFVDCAAAVSFTPWSADRWREFVAKALDSKDIDRELYIRRYPELARLTESPNTNLVRSNITLRCGELLRRPPRAVDCSNNTILAEGDFAFPANTKLLHAPGFTPIMVSEIGLRADKWRKASGALRARATQ